MARYRKKSIYSTRSVVLGFDETNNGLGLKSQNPHYPHSLIVTGYLGDTTKKDKNYQGSPYEDKGGVFNGTSDFQEVLRRSCHFLSGNPNFLYTHVPAERVRSNPIELMKAQSIALLTMGFITTYQLDPDKIQLVIDQMDGKEHSKKVGTILEIYLERARLDIPIRFIKGGENEFIPIRKADRVGYYLTALHFLGKNHKWPLRRKKLSLDRLEDLTIELLERKENQYHN